MNANHFFRGFLNGWLLKNIPGSKHVEMLDGLDGFHVIKTCGKCRFWSKEFKLPGGLPPEAKKDLEGTHRQCECEESPVMVAPIRFGCVHFKEKL